MCRARSRPAALPLLLCLGLAGGRSSQLLHVHQIADSPHHFLASAAALDGPAFKLWLKSMGATAMCIVKQISLPPLAQNPKASWRQMSWLESDNGLLSSQRYLAAAHSENGIYRHDYKSFHIAPIILNVSRMFGLPLPVRHNDFVVVFSCEGSSTEAIRLSCSPEILSRMGVLQAFLSVGPVGAEKLLVHFGGGDSNYILMKRFVDFFRNQSRLVSKRVIPNKAAKLEEVLVDASTEVFSAELCGDGIVGVLPQLQLP